MYQLVYKQKGDINWKYTDWVEDISVYNNKFNVTEFFVLNQNHMIVYSS